MSERRTNLDLGIGDVGTPSGSRGTVYIKGPPTEADAANALGRMFPKARTPKRDTRAADTALEKAKSSMTPAAYATARRRIAKTAKKAPKKSVLPRAGRGLRMSIDTSTGQVHVVHMADGVLHPEVPITCADAGTDTPVWIQLAMAGRFEGHPAAKFEFNASVFDSIIRNFQTVDLGQVAFDFEHASEQPPSEGDIGVSGAPAQGWIRKLENRGNSLWGLVDWLEPARTYIREGKYKYVSPAIRWKAVNPRTGEAIGPRMSSAALTNKPFLRGMSAVTASDQNMGDTTLLATYAYSTSEYMPKIRNSLRLSELSSAQECSDAMDRLTDAYEAGGGDVHQGIDVPGYITAMREMVSAPLHSTVEEIFDAVRKMIEAAIEEHEATMHPGEDDDSDLNATDISGESTSATNGDTTMADQDVKKLEGEKVTLMSEKATLLSEKETLLSQNASLTLKLNEASSARATLETEVTTLRDWKKDRETKDIDNRVNGAFETYKDKRKLTDADKRAMRIVLCSDPKTFEELYPVVSANEQHLLHDISGNGKGRDERPRTGDDTSDVFVSMADLARQISTQRGIPLADAQRIVANIPK